MLGNLTNVTLHILIMLCSAVLRPAFPPHTFSANAIQLTATSLTWEADWGESAVSVCPLLSSPSHLGEDASLACPSRPASYGPSPTLLSAVFSPFHVPALSPSPSLSAAAPSHGDLVPSLCLGAAHEGLGHAHAPVNIAMVSSLV